MKKFLTNKLILIESLIIILPLVAYYIVGIQDKNLYPEFLVNAVFIALLLNQIISRSSSIRHMYFAFIFLLLTIFGDVLGFSKFVYISSSFTLSFFILGAANMILFGSKNFSHDPID